MLRKIINVFRKNNFNIYIGKVYKDIHGITANYYLQIQLNKYQIKILLDCQIVQLEA